MSAVSLNVQTHELLSPAYVRQHKRRQEKPVDAIPTPLDSWNKYCRDDGGGVGLAPGWHVVVAGNTGTGKSLWAINHGAAAIRSGESVGFLSLEMSSQQLATRLYACLTHMDVRQLERGEHWSPEAYNTMSDRLSEIGDGARWFTNDVPIHDIARGVEWLAYLHEMHGVRFFIVDYLQLAGAADVKTLREQVSNVSATVREFAIRNNVITVGLSQLNRQTSGDRTQKPTVQGLMATSSLENDADQVVLLDHSRYDPFKGGAMTWLLLAKNRHGSQGDIPIEWNYRTLTAREAMPHEEDKWPQ